MKRDRGSGLIFESEARRRFMALTGSRFDSLVKRLARKGIPVPFTKEKFRAHVLNALGGAYDSFLKCRYCGGFFNVQDIAADHEIPLSRGGSAELWNIGYPCQGCNDRKGSLTPNEFLKLLAFLEAEIPLGRQDVLSRLSKATALAQGARSNAAVIQGLKKKGIWQQEQKERRDARKAKERF